MKVWLYDFWVWDRTSRSSFGEPQKLALFQLWSKQEIARVSELALLPCQPVGQVPPTAINVGPSQVGTDVSWWRGK